MNREEWKMFKAESQRIQSTTCSYNYDRANNILIVMNCKSIF